MSTPELPPPALVLGRLGLVCFRPGLAWTWPVLGHAQVGQVDVKVQIRFPC